MKRPAYMQARLEPTFSIKETGQHLGLGDRAVRELIALGLEHGARLHPTRGGLWPTFKAGHKSRRVTLAAIERHKRHQARLHGEPEPAGTIWTDAATPAA